MTELKTLLIATAVALAISITSQQSVLAATPVQKLENGLLQPIRDVELDAEGTLHGQINKGQDRTFAGSSVV
ncbi:MAG: hypothetical protein N2C12_04295, partial [Planctomycetales bacterium]